MEARKKRGIGFLISGFAFLIAALIMFTTASTPAWFDTAVAVVGMLCKFFGFVVVFPDTSGT